MDIVNQHALALSLGYVNLDGARVSFLFVFDLNPPFLFCLEHLVFDIRFYFDNIKEYHNVNQVDGHNQKADVLEGDEGFEGEVYDATNKPAKSKAGGVA